MNKNTANNLMMALLKLNESTNDVFFEIEKIDDDKIKRLFRRSIANVIGMIYLELMSPIIEEYPDLDPDKK
ncbi:nuclear receptor NHR-99 [Salmonella enterica subsp. enterica serovar Weltevreden]|nr:nuclear receptor NHR-99 [Salmonella enterica subsp. enterica serovar Weltevreden]